MITIKVPCSSANIGPGFDVIGLALSIYLELRITVDESRTDFDAPLNCEISYEGQGAEEVSRDATVNLITRVALYVLKCHGQSQFPRGTHLHIINPIPLGRGLGSSGAAVVGGVMVANEIGKLGLSKARMFDYCLMIERHPDNVGAALFGGLVGTYLNELEPEDTQRKEIPLAEVLPQPAGGEDTGIQPPEPPLNIGHYFQFTWAKEIKCVAVIPDFEVPTSKAREVLPKQYSREDVIFNLQRVALLTTALGQSPPNSDMIYKGMQDKVHQPYRKGLIPRLTDILSSVTPDSHPGLLGICLSGAGPTILALATHNFEHIAEHLLSEFEKENITCEWMLLEPAYDGATATHSADPTPATFQQEQQQSMTYADAGVSIDRGNELVTRIKSAVRSTARPGADATIGGFGGAINLAAAGYKEAPILVQAIDGVGTKLKIAFEMQKYDTVGIDLVAMNVNDLVVQGAEPISFLDYFACSKLDVDVAASFVEGVARGCKMADCALVGGETAEMPGMYADGEFDAAGEATGCIRQGVKVLPDVESMRAGDVLLGLGSSGCHSNGFSLVRKVLERAGLKFTDQAPWQESKTVGDALLEPTKIYVKPLLAITRRGLVKGMSHITGGGLYDNVPRMLPSHLAAEMEIGSWPVPPVLKWLKRAGKVRSKEFARAWNTGLGMVLVVDKHRAETAKDILEEWGEKVYEVGKLVKREQDGCVLLQLDEWDEWD
ncbi:phosphoribosylformylglycinamidine cycl [Rhizodiscina lignyota]|uniref:Homoserine kinase n=1 Tax=Rhizodiscina lignyota TaxID=1504668 RepID=A0A9P4M2W5_9PEZI|nr:phosphoribosylformylglycinamidine cycl [Rhizodiscina lignyota]